MFPPMPIKMDMAIIKSEIGKQSVIPVIPKYPTTSATKKRSTTLYRDSTLILIIEGTENCKISFGMLCVPIELNRAFEKSDMASKVRKCNRFVVAKSQLRLDFFHFLLQCTIAYRLQRSFLLF